MCADPILHLNPQHLLHLKLDVTRLTFSQCTDRRDLYHLVWHNHLVEVCHIENARRRASVWMFRRIRLAIGWLMTYWKAPALRRGRKDGSSECAVRKRIEYVEIWYSWWFVIELRAMSRVARDEEKKKKMIRHFGPRINFGPDCRTCFYYKSRLR